jgi:hypothetical protein
LATGVIVPVATLATDPALAFVPCVFVIAIYIVTEMKNLTPAAPPLTRPRAISVLLRAGQF